MAFSLTAFASLTLYYWKNINQWFIISRLQSGNVFLNPAVQHQQWARLLYTARGIRAIDFCAGKCQWMVNWRGENPCWPKKSSPSYMQNGFPPLSFKSERLSSAHKKWLWWWDETFLMQSTYNAGWALHTDLGELKNIRNSWVNTWIWLHLQISDCI